MLAGCVFYTRIQHSLSLEYSSLAKLPRYGPHLDKMDKRFLKCSCFQESIESDGLSDAEPPRTAPLVALLAEKLSKLCEGVSFLKHSASILAILRTGILSAWNCKRSSTAIAVRQHPIVSYSRKAYSPFYQLWAKGLQSTSVPRWLHSPPTSTCKRRSRAWVHFP